MSNDIVIKSGAKLDQFTSDSAIAKAAGIVAPRGYRASMGGW